MGYLVQTVTTGCHLEDQPHGLHVLVCRKSGLLAVLVWRPGETIGCVSASGYLALPGLFELSVHEPVSGVLTLPLCEGVEHGVAHHVPSIVEGQQLNTVVFEV